MANARVVQRPVLKVPARLAGAPVAGTPLVGVTAPQASASSPSASSSIAGSFSGTTWSCQAVTLDAKGQPGSPVTQSLTVGETFLVSCEGATVQMRADKIFLLAPKENLYALKLLQLREVRQVGVGINKISFIATTYVASEKGPLPISGYVLTDGAHSALMSPLQLQSHSVIAQDKNPDRKPFGPFAPLTISYPLWLWLVMVLIATGAVALLTTFIVRRNARRKFKLELARETSVLSPYNQFNKELRVLGRMGVMTEKQPWTSERATEMLTTLRSAVRWYVAREFEIPAHQISSLKTLKALAKLRARKLGGRFQADEKEIATALRELERALTRPAAVSHAEILQLSELCRHAIERLNKWPVTRASVGVRP